jgi:hypothetical protein
MRSTETGSNDSSQACSCLATDPAVINPSAARIIARMATEQPGREDGRTYWTQRAKEEQAVPYA